jgi:hypothetical protein
MRAAPLFACALPLAAAGCLASRAQIDHTALTRAAFDLDCPRAELTPTPLGDSNLIGATPQSAGLQRSVVGVTGCGKKAVYVVECVHDSCNALLNADEKKAP